MSQWFPIAFSGQLSNGTEIYSQLLEQPIRIVQHGLNHVTCQIVSTDGNIGPNLPVAKSKTLYFTKLGGTSLPSKSCSIPDIKEFYEKDRRIVNCGSIRVRTSPGRIIENFLDMAHFSFVHNNVLGDSENTEVLNYNVEHREDVDEIWATDCCFFQPAASRSAAESGVGQITQYTYRIMSPFSVMLYKTAKGYQNRYDVICLFIQPYTATDCACYMPMALLDVDSTTTALIDFQQSIFLQDRIILENQRPLRLPLTPRTETPTRADLSSVAYRRWLKDIGLQFGIERPEDD